MICRPADLPTIFEPTRVPAGPIPQAAAEAIARLLLDSAERAGDVERAGAGRKEGEPE